MSLKAIRAKVTKKHGEDSITTFASLENIIRFQTESLILNDIFGGGVPARFVHLFGPPSGGKSAISTYIAGQFQKAGKKVAYFDAEGTFHPDFAKKTFGFDISDEDSVFFSQEASASIVYDTMLMLVENKEVDLIVLDTFDSLSTEAENEGEIGDAHMAQMARLNSQTFKKLIPKIQKNKIHFIAASQIREKIGSYGGGETWGGGRSIEFWASIRVRVSKADLIKRGSGENTEVVGQKVKMITHKNKTAAPFKTGEITVLYYKGVQAENEIVDMGVKYGIVDKGGAWFTLPEVEGKFQGAAKAADYLKEHPEYADKLRKEISAIMAGVINKEGLQNTNKIIESTSGKIIDDENSYDEADIEESESEETT